MRRDDRLAAAAGTSVNSVATMRMPLLARELHQRREACRQRGDVGADLPGAAIGPFGMQEVVLQIARISAVVGLFMAALDNDVAEPVDARRRGRARSQWWRRAARESPALRWWRRPAGRAATRWRCRASRRRTRPCAMPASGLLERAPTHPARTPRNRTPGAGRSPRRAATRSARQARQQAAERGRIRRLECCADQRFASTPLRVRRDRQRHRNGVGLAEIMHVELVEHVDALDRNAGGRDHGARLLGRPPPCARRARPHRGRRACRLRSAPMSWRRSASTQPSAEVMPGKRGTSAHRNPISRISAPTCSAPPPPNGIATNFAGSWPRSIDTSRMAPAMRASATRTIAAAASSTSSPSGSPTCVGDRALRGLDVERFRVRRRAACRIDAAEHDLRVGQGRTRVALAVAGRPRHRAGAFRADLQQSAAVDPRDRAAAGADRGDLDHRRADDQAEIDRGLRRHRGLAVRDHRHVERGAAEIAGDEVVKAGRLGERRARDHAGGRAGSAVRTGKRRAVAVDMMPPFDCTICSCAAKLSSPARPSSLAMIGARRPAADRR